MAGEDDLTMTTTFTTTVVVSAQLASDISFGFVLEASSWRVGQS